MNTQPDNVELALWLEDEMSADELASFQQRGEISPEHFAERERLRNWKSLMGRGFPSEIEPPYPDFFNARVAKEIRAAQMLPPQAFAKKTSWRAWLLPPSALAALALAFWLGGMMQGSGKRDQQISQIPAPRPSFYVPEEGVKAELVGNSRTATVIVLQGVQPISNELTLTDTARTSLSQNPASAIGMEHGSAKLLAE